MALFFLFTLFTVTFARVIERIPITADFANSTNWVLPTQIVGGMPVGSATDYPWTAAYMEDDYQFCGASIIAPRWAVTAAHCIGVFNPNSEYISVGSLRFDDNDPSQPLPVKVKVERAFRNPAYVPGTFDTDVGLLYLAEALEYNEYIQPIKLAPSSSGDFTGDISVILGWGTTTEGGIPSLVLREVDVPIISNEECNQYYSTITDTMLCAYVDGGGKDSCQGDSGGPTVVREGDEWVLVGLVSWGLGCARPFYPGVYTRVSSVYSWICANTQGAVC